MHSTIKLQKKLLIFGLPLLIIGFSVFLAQSHIFQSHADSLAMGITFDLLIVGPILYFLFIRKTSIPNTTVVPIFILGIVVCSLIIPVENQHYLNLFKSWVLPVVEIFVLTFFIYKTRKAVKSFQHKKHESIDFYDALKLTCSEILPRRVVNPVVTEIAVLFYGFIYWRKRKLKENEFTYHKDNGAVTLYFALLFIVALETITLHVLLSKWSTTAAWILTLLSVYSGIQIFGFVKAMFKRPIYLKNNTLYLRYGIMKETTLNLANIESIEVSSKDIEIGDEAQKLSLLGELESHNLILKLKEPETMFGLYGTQRKYKTLALHVDQKEEFVQLIHKALEQKQS
ncbi:hypothetical protein SAMN05216474_0436 [Lishizhenia tianjinensis]|uniref:PH domain-containing protein n=1 Tax=Lishizhenia tianjinensis TaxID=477690 RepID=A0A1I6XU50_9FLAO|nr:hypothetical protein [Lishizhenia tianjinensis]SFT41552.1 hypothetical protein SAMN05216474_0436 [Lishizhenia tianjinensis]